MVDSTTVALGLLGVVGTLLGSALTYYYTDLRRSREVTESILGLGSQIMAAFLDLAIHLGEHESELAPIRADNWLAKPPQDSASLSAVLDRALGVFPLPGPRVKVPSGTGPYLLLLELNLKDAQDWIRSVNEKAEPLRKGKRDSEAIAAFLGEAQFLVTPEAVESMALAIYDNMLDSAAQAQGGRVSERKKRKEIEVMRRAFRDDIRNRIGVTKTVQDYTARFRDSLRKIPKAD